MGRRGVPSRVASTGTDDEENISALFLTRRDNSYGIQEWDGDRIVNLIEAFETDARNTAVPNVGRTLPYHRLSSLRDRLEARAEL